MPFLAAAVVLIGAVLLVNLVLTLGLVRRMRQYATLLDALQPAGADEAMLPAGSAVPPFRATATDGTAVDGDWFDTPVLVGFFSPGCPPCHDLLPAFVAAAAGRRALAVVEDGDQPAGDYVSALAPVAPVLVGGDARRAVAAFAVRGFPSVCEVDGHGVVSGTGTHLLHAPHPVGRMNPQPAEPARPLRTLGVALGLAGRAAPGGLLLLVLLALVAAGVPVVAAWCTKGLLDGIADPGTTWPDLTGVVAGLLVAGVVGAVQPHASDYLRTDLGRRTGLAAQDRLYRAVNGFQGLRRFEDPVFLDRLRMAQQCGQDTPEQIVSTTLTLLRTTVTMGGFFGSLLVISPRMAWIVLLAAVPTLLGELRLARARVSTTIDVTRLERRELFYGALLADVQAAKEIRLFGLGDHFRRRLRTERTAINALHRRMDRRTLLTQGGLALLAAVTAAGGLIWAAHAAAGGALSVGDVSIFVAAVAAVQVSLAGLAVGAALGHQHLLLFGHYLTVTGTPPDLPALAPARPVGPLRGGIELRDVWFRYTDDQPWILRGVTLTVPHGRSLALVGANGAGKSTLVKLLCRFYDPTRGAILWDGVDLRQVPPAALRERMTAVFQDFMCYDLPAGENIALGDLAAADPAAVRQAAGRAGVHGTLSSLPRGYDTLLSRLFADGEAGGDGMVLSGGQWQRVALARALVRQHRDVLIMDEPSSGLDAEAEHHVQACLRDHREGRTSVLVSHRLGSVREADTIVVLHDGVVAERGGHEELMAAGGRYARLFNLQAEGYAARPATTGATR